MPLSVKVSGRLSGALQPPAGQWGRGWRTIRPPGARPSISDCFMKFPLLSLAAGGFAIGMAEFMLMGVLPNIAQSQGVSIPAAGHLISGYALGVVIGAPLLVALADRYPPRNILVALMVMFGLFNALFAMAPTYELMSVSYTHLTLPTIYSV